MDKSEKFQYRNELIFQKIMKFERFNYLSYHPVTFPLSTLAKCCYKWILVMNAGIGQLTNIDKALFY